MELGAPMHAVVTIIAILSFLPMLVSLFVGSTTGLKFGCFVLCLAAPVLAVAAGPSAALVAWLAAWGCTIAGGVAFHHHRRAELERVRQLVASMPAESYDDDWDDDHPDRDDDDFERPHRHRPPARLEAHSQTLTVDTDLARCAIVAGDGAFGFRVVGTGKHQMELGTIAGGRTEDGVEHYCGALLIPEPSNQYDPESVRVVMAGQTIGYLRHDEGVTFKASLAQGQYAGAACAAKIVGGWDRGGDDRGHFGVRLDTCLPFALHAIPETARPAGPVPIALPSPAMAVAVVPNVVEAVPAHVIAALPIPMRAPARRAGPIAVLLITLVTITGIGMAAWYRGGLHDATNDKATPQPQPAPPAAPFVSDQQASVRPPPAGGPTSPPTRPSPPLALVPATTSTPPGSKSGTSANVPLPRPRPVAVAEQNGAPKAAPKKSAGPERPKVPVQLGPQ
jgi:hypothetical protein